jgi:hypothetical protein
LEIGPKQSDRSSSKRCEGFGLSLAVGWKRAALSPRAFMAGVHGGRSWRAFMAGVHGERYAWNPCYPFELCRETNRQED